MKDVRFARSIFGRYASVSIQKAISLVPEARVVLVGDGFINNARLACKIGDGEVISAQFSSSTEINCPDPGPFAKETSTVIKATVNGIDFSAGSVVFVHSRTPYVLSIYPAKGSFGGGTSVLVAGAHFPNSGGTACSFGGLVVPARWMSGELLQCESPPRPEAGTAMVQVSADGLVFTSEGLVFEYYETRVLGVSPRVGPTDGGTLVSVFGEGFESSADYVVRFGLTYVQANFVSSSQVQCLTPGRPDAGEVQVSVATGGIDVDAGSTVSFVFNPSISLDSIVPAWGPRDEETTVVVHGNGFANTSELACSFGENGTRLVATFVSSSIVSCTIPKGIPKGDYEVEVTTNGQEFSRNGAVFSIEEDPTIVSIFPSSGPQWGGEAIHIKGFNFRHTSELRCLFGSKAVTARWESSNSLWCMSPIGEVGDVRFTVTLDGRSFSSYVTHSFTFAGPSAEQECMPGAESNKQEWNVSLENRLIGRNFSPSEVEDECGSANELTAPTAGEEDVVAGDAADPADDLDTTVSILRIVPDHGSSDGNTTVLVAGTNFIDTEEIQCAFGASAVPGRWISPALVACVTAPGENNGTVPFGVAVNGVVSVSASPLFFVYEEKPTVSAMLPSLGSAQGGTLVTFRGDGFVFSSGLRARFGNIGVPVTFVSPEELRCSCPPSAPGEVSVFVGNHDTMFGGNDELIFTYTDAPAVDVLRPSRGSTTGGLKVRAHGRNFVNTTNLACMFGEAGVVAATFVSLTELDCEVPAVDKPVSQELEITVNGVDFTSDGNVFTYTGDPAVLSATPDSGSASGGTVVLVNGYNFADSSDLSCQFGASLVSGRWISSHAIQCVAPVGIANTTVSLAISFAEGQTKIGDVEFYFFPQPTIEGLSPTHGSIHGGSALSIYGTGFWFSGEARVRLGRTDVPATLVSPSELRCTTPAWSSPGLVNVLVSFNGVDFFGTDIVGYTYVVPARVDALSPPQGPQSGGTSIIVTGSGFRRSSGLGCMFDGQFVAATYQTETQAACVTPPATKDGTVLVAITNDGPESAAEGKVFLYTGGPYISSVHPQRGPVSGGTHVRVHGFNFADAQDTQCVFGSQMVPARRVSATQLWCTSPRSTKTEEVAFSIEIEDARRLSGSGFSYYADPTLVGISPRTGSVEGGTVLDLVGDFYVFSRGMKATVGAVEVPVVYVNSTLLRCTTVASSAQTVEIGLVVEGTQDTSQPTWTYAFQGKPRATEIHPSRGGIAGGIAVSVSGDGFENVSTLGCRFGSSNGKIIHGEFISAQELVCTAPSTTDVGSVPLEVTVNGVDFSENGNRFTYHGSPFITSTSPTVSNMVSVSGGYFVQSEVLFCRFGALIATPGRWISRTLIECAPPASDVTSETEGETFTLAVSFDGDLQTEAVPFEVERTAKVSSLSPSIGSSAGGTAVFFQGSGFNFGGNLRVRFGGLEVPVTFLSDTLLSCVSPAGEAGFTRVVPILGTHAFANTAMQFQYVPDVKVSTVTATSGGITGLETALIRGANFVSTSHLGCRFNGSIRVPGVFISASEIWCDVPQSIEHGQTLLEVSVDGDFFAPAGFIFVRKEEEPLLTLNPSSGPSGGGTLVVISGREFLRAEGIECLFGDMPVSAIWLSEEAIQCESPAFADTLQAYVSVGVDGYAAGRGLFTYTQSAIESVFPEQGEDAGGTLVTLSGRGFEPNIQWFCWFGLEKTPAFVVDDEGTSLQCLSPPRVSSDASVLLSVGAGSSLPDLHSAVSFAYIARVEAFSLHPASGSLLGGTSVVVTLKHSFGDTQPLLYCGFGEAGSSQSVWLNETAVMCESPPSPYRGKVTVNLFSSSTHDNLPGSASTFWYFYPPKVSFVYPLEVEINSDVPSVVTITGGNFEGSGSLSCRLGKAIVNAVWVSGSVIECPVIAVLPGEQAIEVSNNMADFVHAGVITAVPGGLAERTGQVAPGSGSTKGGTIVEIFGPDVGNLGFVRHCVLGDLILNATAPSKDHAECVTKAHQAGTVPVSVCDSSNNCARHQGEFSFVDTPVPTRLVPNTGSLHGTSAVKVEISKGCPQDTGDIWCRLGDANSRASSVRDDFVMCTLPADEEGLFNVSISCNGFDFSDPLPFMRDPEVVVYDVFPVYISTDGGSVIHVSGKGFRNAAGGVSESPRLLCVFDDTPTPSLWVSEALVLCRSPPKSAGMSVLRISTSLREGVVATTNITYVARGHGNSRSYVFNPTAGTMEGGTVVSITGARRLVGPIHCLFGDESTPAVSISSFEIECVTPAAIATGLVEVSLVWPDNKQAIGSFEYKKYLQLDRVRPAVVDIGGGTNVTVFVDQASGVIPDTANTSCKIRDVLVPALVHPLRLSAECVSPAGTPGSAPITLWSGESELSRGHVALSYAPLPTISRVSPTRGFPGGQDEVNVYGHSFVYSQDLACFFGDKKATQIEWFSPTHIQCTVPKQLQGIAQVTVSLDGVRFTSPSVFSTYTAHQDITLEGVSPAVGYAEGGTLVTITGRNFLTSGGLECLFGDDPSPATVVTQNSLECVSPKLSAGTVDVELQYADGGGRVNSDGEQLRFQVLSEDPIVGFVLPPSGPVEGGTSLIVTGAFFSNTTQIICRLQGRASVVDTTADWLSSSAVTCVSPRWRQPERAVTLHLLIGGAIPRSAGNSSMTFDYVVSPIIEDIHPKLGSESGGTEIRLRGANFHDSGTLACLICKQHSDQCTTVEGKRLSAREVRCIAPRHEPGLTTVEIAYGSSGLDATRTMRQFLFVSAPHATNIHPTGGSVEGGTEVLVSGTNLVFTGTAICRFGEVPTQAAFHISGIICTSPRSPTPQKVTLEVSVNGADFTSDGHTFEFLGSNAGVWSITTQPSYGDIRGDTEVVVHVGKAPAFEAPMEGGGYECVFDNQTTPAVVTSPSSVKCRSPSFLGEGIANLRLKAPDGKGETAATRFEVLPAIELLSLEPASGYSAGGDAIIVHGTGFVDTSLACCRFGNGSTPAELLSPTAVRCVVPGRVDDSLRSVVVEVSHNCGDFYGSGLDFRYDLNVLGAWNNSGHASLHSAMGNREHPLLCAVESAKLNSSGHREHLLTCSSHVDALSMDRTPQIVSVENGTKLSLSSGPVEGGSTVEVSGLGELDDGAFCKFSGGGRVVLATAYPLLQEGRLRCVTPPWGGPDTVLVQATNMNMDAFTVSMTFMYYSQPVLYRMDPSRRTANGQTMLHIVASGSSAATNPKCGFFDASNILRAVSTASWTTRTDVWCQSPITEPGRVFVEISANGDDFTRGSGLGLTVEKASMISAVSPLLGAAKGGTEVAVRGTGFGYTSAAVCRFHGIQVTATVVDDGLVVCTAPRLPGEPLKKSVPVDFALTLDGNEVEFSGINTLQFTYLVDPIVSTIYPSTGPVTGGTNVSVEGGNFVDMGSGMDCLFGTAITRARIVSVNRLVCDSPPHSAGEIAVAVTNADGRGFVPKAGPSFFYNSSLRTPLSTNAMVSPTIADTNLHPQDFDSSPNDFIEWGNSHVDFIRPDSGPPEGGTPVEVTGAYPAATGVFMCHFGTQPIRGYVVDNTRAVCSAPPSSARKSVEFYVSINGQRLRSDDIVYLFEDAPIIGHFQPRVLYQGTTNITVTGAGFRNRSSLACLLDGIVIVRGTFLSDTSAMCPMPQNLGHVRLELTNNGVDFSSSGYGVDFTPRPVVTGIDRPAASLYLGAEDVIISGLYFIDVPELACVVGGRRFSARWISTESVVCRLPLSLAPGLLEVAVTLNLQEPDQRPLNFEVVPSTSMVVASVRPAFGACNGGTVVMIEGSNLRGKGTTVCRFGLAGDVGAQVVNDSIAWCVTPSSQLGETRLQVGSREHGFSSTSAVFTYVVQPAVAKLQPPAGSVHGGTRVAVLGSDFANTTGLECHFGTQHAVSVAFVSFEEIICESPPSVAPAVVPVTVSFNGVYSAASINYRYFPGVNVLDVSPRDIYFNETRWLTVTGVHFVSGPALMCLFNGTLTAKAQWLSSSLVRCPVPAALRPGKELIPVSVMNNGQDKSTSSASILIRPRLTVHSVAPAKGPLDENTPVVVILRASGAYAQHYAEQQVFCLFDEEPVKAVSALAPVHMCGMQTEELSLTCVAVRCTAPTQQVARNASLRIVDGAGASFTNAATFAFEAMPTVRSISPRYGTFGGGSAITIDHWPTEWSTMPETVGCQFSDAYDMVYVVGAVSMAESGLLSVDCISPPWRTSSGYPSKVKVEPVLDGIHIAVDNNSFTYFNRAQIFAVTPRWTTDKGGTEIRIRGIGFSSRSRFTCFFKDQTPPGATATTDHLLPTLAVRLSDEELLCESPAHPPGPAYITVTADGDEVDGKLQIVVRPSTKVESLSPSRGLASGGTIVALSGDNFFFTGLTMCRFGSFDVPATFVNSRSLLCVSPRSPPGTYLVSVAMDGRHFENSGLSFEYLEAMSILSLTPAFGWTTGGANVTVHVAGWHGYSQDASFLCVFGGHREAAINVDLQGGTMVCSSPTLAQTMPGKGGDGVMTTTVSVVESSGAFAAAAAKTFRYVAPVTVTAVVPDRGPADTPVQVWGENFDASFGLECVFGDMKARATFVSSQRVDCRAPANETGQVQVNVLSGGGLPAWHVGALFTFNQPFVLLSLHPEKGRSGDNTAVTITGSGFQPSANLLCRFGELEASATYINSTHIRCLAPPGGRGDVRVSISVHGEHVPLMTSSFFYETEARIAPLVPSAGSVYGGTLLNIRVGITSTTADLRCTFSSENAVSTSSEAEADGDSIQCRTPPSPGLTVGVAWMSLTQGGTEIAGAIFRFLNPPVVHSVHPQHSYKHGGDMVVISGDNFVPSEELACKFSSLLSHRAALAPAQFVSNTKMSCVTPVWDAAPTAATRVAVDVTTNGVDFTSGGPGFMLQPAARVSAVSPSVGLTTGGTPVTLYGVFFPRRSVSCLFGYSIVPALVLSGSHAVCISPKMSHGFGGRVPLHLVIDGRVVPTTEAAFTYVRAQPSTDPILRTTTKDDGEAAQVAVNGHGQQYLNQDAAGALSIPSIVRSEPSGCSSSGTVAILVHGSNFRSSPNLTCSFGGVYRNATFLSDVAVQCFAPRHMPSDVLLEVSNDGSAFSTSGLKFRFHSDPSILSVDPSHGSVEGSTLVTITGSHFRNASNVNCLFGDTAVAGRYLSSNLMECWTPPMERIGAAVEVKVRTVYGAKIPTQGV